MLSKFYCYYNDEADKADVFDTSALSQKIKEIYLKDAAVEAITPGGTLGIFYQVKINDKKKFIKTHRKGEMYRQNLLKEVELMNVLYGNILDISSFDIHYEGLDKTFMIMDYLDKPNSQTYETQFVRNMITNNIIRLNDIPSDLINYNAEDLYNAAIKSYEVMIEADFLSPDLCRWCEKALIRLEKYGSYDKVLCHGDLSNANIIPWKDSAVVIDWEDALFAYPEYDLLYWLTFYSQRRFYNSHLFEDIGVGEQYGKDIMVMILLIKSYLSYVNESYKKNKLSISDRISEIIYM